MTTGLIELSPKTMTPNLSVAVVGPSGSGKTHAGTTMNGQLWLALEPNAEGTIIQQNEKVIVVDESDALGLGLKSLLKTEIPSNVPIVIRLYAGTPEEKVARVESAVKWVHQNAEALYKMGRRSVILDSFSDVNANIVDAMGSKNNDQVQMKDWQKVKMHCLHRVLEPLRQLTYQGFDLLVTCGMVDNAKESPGGSLVHLGYKPMIQGAAKDMFLFRFMAGAQLESRTKVNRQTKEVEGIERVAVFQGHSGQVCKSMGDLGREPINFKEWKAKAFPGYNGESK